MRLLKDILLYSFASSNGASSCDMNDFEVRVDGVAECLPPVATFSFENCKNVFCACKMLTFRETVCSDHRKIESLRISALY